MRRLLPIPLLLLLGISGFGQSPTSNCPAIKVVGPDKLTYPGSPMTFVLDLSGPQSIGTPTYAWTVSTGAISSGQGTRSITVDTTGLDGANVTATTEVKGLLIGCNSKASDTVSVAIVHHGDYDSYGKIPWNDERARLDNIWIALGQEPDSRLFIFVRITEEEPFDATRKHAKKMVGHIKWRDKKFDLSRITFIIYVDNAHETTPVVLSKGVEPPKFCDSGCIQISGSDLIKK